VSSSRVAMRNRIPTRTSVFQVDYQLDKMYEKPSQIWVWRRSRLCGGVAAVGDRQERSFQLSFNSRLRVDFQGAGVTSDGGWLLVRELDERLGPGQLIERHLTDGRGKNTQLPLPQPCAAVGIQPPGGL